MEDNQMKKIVKICSDFEEPTTSSIYFNREKESKWYDLKHIFDELLSKNYIDSDVWYKCIILARLNLGLPIISKGIISVKI